MKRERAMRHALCLLLLSSRLGGSGEPVAFVNFESHPVHGLDISPNGRTMAVCNLPDGRVELFDLETPLPTLKASVPVGVDPVSVRFRHDRELWVVNLISDSISIIDIEAETVVATVQTGNEPYDVVFAGSQDRAFVSLSIPQKIQIIDPISRRVVESLPILAPTPRALSVSPDGSQVYVTMFESGNATTILGGGKTSTDNYPPDVVNHPEGPYGGVNPPPNDGADFSPPLLETRIAPPRVGLIVRKNEKGQWLDENRKDWSDFVSGERAGLSGRIPGWDMPDRDLAIIDADSLEIQYVSGLMNICMAQAVNPVTGEITVVGTEATNEIRFEPVIAGRFVRVQLATVNPETLATEIIDLNGAHLDYSNSTASQEVRDLSLGDPRGIVWDSSGSIAYIVGMGSNNLLVINPDGTRRSPTPLRLDAGPVSVALNESLHHLYTLNRFASTLSVVDTHSGELLETIDLHDPTPALINAGRRHLYDTHATSGLGQLACASCHVDGRADRLSWDLGDPAGELQVIRDVGAGAVGGHNLFLNLDFEFEYQPFHPMKGPMLTQTLHDIIGKEPLHWRGDRQGIESFNDAFKGLNGDDETLTATQMQEFEDFLATLRFEPNPYRAFDNTLPNDLPLPGHRATGTFDLAAGAPLPNGDAQMGLSLFRDGQNPLAGDFSCVFCHTLPSGMGSDRLAFADLLIDMPPGPMGQNHVSITLLDGNTNGAMKIPSLRNLYRRVGFDTSQQESLVGFGFEHDGAVDSLSRFLGRERFSVASDSDTAHLLAFLLSFSGSDLVTGSTRLMDAEPLGPSSLDAHAAMGKQVTISGPEPISLFGEEDLIATMTTFAADVEGRLDLVVKGVLEGQQRGWFYDRVGNLFLSDRWGEVTLPSALLALASAETPLTYTLVARGTGRRIGIDRDGDGVFDQSDDDPADPLVPGPS